MSQRAYRLQEFTAHGSKVNCLRIGRKSGRVLVTGGDDKRVNLWSIGKTNSIMSLEGHVSPVESVCFDAGEEVVVAGSQGGTIKLWDLDNQKVVRTLDGHKARCISVDFHPFGEFFASGSTDTNLKIWDIRRKGCIQTYKGHTKAINIIRFSPDGRWVVSGGEDGLIKLWDLTAGKMLQELKGHTDTVSGLEFHPQEFLLASSSADRTIKFWDLESFEMVSSSEPFPSSSATSNNYTSPLNFASLNAPPPSQTPATSQYSVRPLSFSADGSALFCTETNSLRVLGWEPVRTFDTVPVAWADVLDLNVAADQLFAASANQSVVSVHIVNLQKVRPFSLKDSFTPNVVDNTAELRRAETPKSKPVATTAKTNSTTSNELRTSNHERSERNIDRSGDRTPQKKVDRNSVDRTNEPSINYPEREEKDRARPVARDRQPAVAPPSQPEPVSISRPPAERYDVQVSPTASSAEMAEQLLRGHNVIGGTLQQRLDHLRIVRNMWARGDVRDSLEQVIAIGDPAVACDIVTILLEKPTLFTLDICVVLMPILNNLMSEPTEEYVLTALKAIQQLAITFGPLVKSTLEAPLGKGVDLQREQRMEKCSLAMNGFKNVRNRAEVLKDKYKGGKVGQILRAVMLLLKDIVLDTPSN